MFNSISTFFASIGLAGVSSVLGAAIVFLVCVFAIRILMRLINTALDTIRKRKREELSDTLPEAVWEDSYGDVDLRGVLERLDDRSRTVVILRYFEDMKLEDVARTVGENLNTVKARLYRALKKLRLDLEAGAYEASGKEKPR